MAQKTIVSLIDDLSGEEADETVRFGLDGAQYEIDLSVLLCVISKQLRLGPSSKRSPPYV